MLSQDKMSVFLKLQQSILDIEEGTKLIDQFMPMVLQEITSLGYNYDFLSAIFIDKKQNIKQTFFIEKSNMIVKPAADIINLKKLFEKGSSWDMELLFGNPVKIANIGPFIKSYSDGFLAVKSLLLLPITSIHKLSGVLIIGARASANQIKIEEIEFMQMINRLIDLGFRLQDTENSLTSISQQVYEMNAKLHQLDKLKDDFVSVASHELRTPMTAIRSYVWMALHRSDIPLSQKLEKYLYRTLISTERLINLVNDMLNVSRIESGRIEIKPQSFDLTKLVEDIIEEVHARSDEKELKLLVLQNKIPQVFADCDKVHQIFLNLIGNSIKFTPPGGAITISFFTDGKVVETAIKDTGPGISKDDLNKLFKKFARLDNSYVSISTSGGTGLGLYISKSLIDLMKGKIWASSEGSGKGTTFTFTLPVATHEVEEHKDDFKVTPDGEIKQLEPVMI